MSYFSPLFPSRRSLRFALSLFVAAFLNHSNAVELPVLSDPTVTQGNPVQGQPGVREGMGKIAAREKLQGTTAHLRHSYIFRRMPASRAIGTETNASGPPVFSGPNIQTLNSNLNFTAAYFTNCSGWPPDTMGAVGPAQFITALNGRVRSFNKTNGVQDGGIDVGTDTFFQSVVTPPASSNFTTDPRIRFDRLSGRWFVTMIDVPGQKGTLPNRVMIAMSDSGTITSNTVWTFFEFPGDSVNFADYPTLGIDANALYIGANIFSTSGSGGLVNTSAFVVRKSSLLSGGPIVYTPFTGLITISGTPHHQIDTGPFTPQGVDNFDPAATEGYFIGVDIMSSSTLQLRRVSNPGGTPSMSGNVGITVNTFASPINVTVSGTSGTVDGLDVRLLAAHYRNGSLWTSQNVGVNSSGTNSTVDRNGSCWYQITNIPTGQTPSVLQSGTVYIGSSNVSCWMGTIMVSGQGHAAMGCTVAGPSTFLNAAWMGRLVGDPAGAMGVPALYTASSFAYNPTDGSNPHRWGDFSFTSLDPSDDMTMWTIQEWCQTNGNGFAVQAAQLRAPLPATPVNCNPSSLAAGASNVNVVVTGQVVSGSGFFDPGAGFASHISAGASTGDVIINSVTYNNPTNITLNVSVAPAAAAGARLITVTNPDGQSVTSSTGILTVTNGVAPPPPVANFTASPTNGVAPLAVTFTNTSTGAASYNWNFGDGSSNTIANPGHTYTNAGTYTVTLTAVGAGGTNSLTRSNYIVVTNPPPPPVASFNGTPTNGPAPLAVSFANSSTGATNYNWNFGDGHSSAATNPAHTYTNAGAYTVTLTAVGAGGTNILTLPNYIVVTNLPPSVAFVASPTNGVAPLTVNFTNLSSGATNYSWNFGDGQTNGNANPIHTYTNAGSYTVVLTAFGIGGSNSLARSNYIVVTSPPPVASFSGSPTSGPAPLTVNFSNSSTGATNYNWNFGDGSSNAVANPAHTYTNAGTYSVTLTAVGAGGTNSLTRPNYIVVTNPPPSVDFVAAPTNGGAALTVYFTNLTSGATNYSWSFGDGQTNNSISPTNVYQSEGSYTVALTAFGPGGQVVFTRTNYIVLSNSPPVLAPIANQAVHPGMTLVITNSATDPDAAQSLSYSLDPGAPPTATIDSASGIFSWTPDSTYANTTNGVTVRVTDNGVLPLSDAKTFSVAVVPLAFQPVILSNDLLTISWTSISGVTYRVQYTTNLTGTNWATLPPDITATGETANMTDTTQPDGQRFYRVFVVP